MKFPKRSLLIGAACGFLVGLACRWPSIFQEYQWLSIMSLAFIFILPMAMGAVTVAIGGGRQISLAQAFFWPWLPILAGTFVMFISNREGAICSLMFLPAGLVLGSVGGVIAGLVFKKRPNPLALASILVLPFATQFIENKLPTPLANYEVHSEIRVRGRAEDVWQQIKSVPTITKQELPNSWVHKIGFPRPLDAVVNKESLGGVRKARFERGLVFDETIDRWQPPRELGFSIRALPVPPQTLDEHVTIGGPYFDVLHGLYSIEPAGDGEVVLHLRSQFRLSTHFNFYTEMWTEMVMQRIQSDILSVIKARSENAKAI